MFQIHQRKTAASFVCLRYTGTASHTDCTMARRFATDNSRTKNHRDQYSTGRVQYLQNLYVVPYPTGLQYLIYDVTFSGLIIHHKTYQQQTRIANHAQGARHKNNNTFSFLMLCSFLRLVNRKSQKFCCCSLEKSGLFGREKQVKFQQCIIPIIVFGCK